MAARLSALLLLTGLTGIHSITTVSKVSVKSGGSISVPCLYEFKYREHVKYLCQGRVWSSCKYSGHSNKPGYSGRFSISDDKQQRIFTVTIRDLTGSDSYYWCNVEKTVTDDGTLFQLSVTTGRPQLSVDHQRVTGFIGEDVTIHCHYSVGGESWWCRLGGSCVKEWTGSIEGTTVTIDATVPQVFSVTLRGLRTWSSGWYYCSKGGLQMPVHLTVEERPRTTKASVQSDVPTTQATTRTGGNSVTTPTATTSSKTFSTSARTNTSEHNNITTQQPEAHRDLFYLLALIIPLALLILIVTLAFIIWFHLKRQKQTNKQPSAAGDEVTYSTVRRVRHTSNKAGDGVTYSAVRKERRTSNKAGDEVIYSTVREKRHTSNKAGDEVTYSAVRKDRHANIKAGDEVTYSAVKHARHTSTKGPAQDGDVTYSTLDLH